MIRFAKSCLPTPLSLGIRVLMILVWMNIPTRAWGHDPGLSVATARLEESALTIHLAIARSDVEQKFTLTMNSNRDGRISEAEFNQARPLLLNEAHEIFAVSCGGQALKLTHAAVMRDLREGFQFDLRFARSSQGEFSICSTWLEKLPRGHRQFFSVSNQDNHRLIAHMLDASHPSLSWTIAPPVPASMQPHSIREFVIFGIEHIVTGFDHLLFLLGLLLAGNGLRSAIQIITSFTAAHSVTLALATLGILNFSPTIIEPLIAGSIVYVGLENLLRQEQSKRWILAFGFGLIHGCGFASALRDLGIGDHGASIILPLVSFNAGVELGQLALASLLLPLLWKCQVSPLIMQRGIPAGSILIVVAGSYWLVERIWL